MSYNNLQERTGLPVVIGRRRGRGAKSIWYPSREDSLLTRMSRVSPHKDVVISDNKRGKY